MADMSHHFAGRRRLCTLDEELFCAEDTLPKFEVLPGEDIKKMPLLRPQQAKLKPKRQRSWSKRSFVTRSPPVYLASLDYSKHTTKSGKHAVDGKFMKKIWPDIHKGCCKPMPTGVKTILLLDRATTHTCERSRKMLDALFGNGNWFFLSPKSPDLSMCDAAVFPNMKRRVGVHGATAEDEIWEAYRAEWGSITPETRTAMDQRVWRNTLKVRTHKGGNFYDESTA